MLGLVGRDLLFDLIEAVADEDGPRAFALADRAVESGHDLKLVCRELTRAVRDIMMVSVDPARAGEGELADGERARLTALAGRFSREDLMRAFDLLAKCEQDIRVAAHPRYHFEMAMLKWMHLRRLVPLADLIEQLGSGRSALPSAVKPAMGRPRSRALQAGLKTRNHVRSLAGLRTRSHVRHRLYGARAVRSRTRCWRRFAAARGSSTTPSSRRRSRSRWPATR